MRTEGHLLSLSFVSLVPRGFSVNFPRKKGRWTMDNFESDLRSNEHYLSSREIKACTEFEPMTSAILYQ